MRAGTFAVTPNFRCFTTVTLFIKDRRKKLCRSHSVQHLQPIQLITTHFLYSVSHAKFFKDTIYLNISKQFIHHHSAASPDSSHPRPCERAVARPNRQRPSRPGMDGNLSSFSPFSWPVQVPHGIFLACVFNVKDLTSPSVLGQREGSVGSSIWWAE